MTARSHEQSGLAKSVWTTQDFALMGCHDFDLELHAPGFWQYIRRTPIHVPTQSLDLDQRGGHSFDEIGFQ